MLGWAGSIGCFQSGFSHYPRPDWLIDPILRPCIDAGDHRHARTQEALVDL